MKVYKVADVVNGEVMLSDQRKYRLGDIAAILTNFEPVEPIDNARPDSCWTVDISIGEGKMARIVHIQLPPLILRSDPPEIPLFLGDKGLIYFRDRLFMPERLPKTASEREEIILRVKKAVYDEEVDLSSLKASVANLEAAIEYSKSGPKRDPIPEDVKLAVWARDGGACARCGSKLQLHFDHIIPVIKGGGNSVENIQILCQVCNLKKSDKIANI